MEADLSFHVVLARASRNPVFELITGLSRGSRGRPGHWVGKAAPPTRRGRACLIPCRNCARAVAKGDPQAAQEAMATHFDESVRAPDFGRDGLGHEDHRAGNHPHCRAWHT